MITSKRLALGAAVVLIGPLMGFQLAGPRGKADIQPKSEVLDVLREMAAGQRESISGTAAVSHLQADKIDFLRQLILFDADSPGGESVRLAVRKAMVEARPAAGDLARAAAPFANSDERDLSASASRLLDSRTHTGRNGTDFSAFTNVVFTIEPESGVELAIWMLERDPIGAFQSMVDGEYGSDRTQLERMRTLLLAAHEIDDSLWRERWGLIPRGTMTPQGEQWLNELLRDDEWWVRAFVAATMSVYRPSRDQARITACCGDQHEAVQRLVATLCPAP